MKVRYIANVSGFHGLKKNKAYECIGIERGWYRIIDESGEDYLYPPELIEEIETEINASEIHHNEKGVIAKNTNRTHITAAYKEGLISIWWYTDSGEFWDFSATMDNAVECHGYLQYSTEKNHLNLWRDAVNTFVEDESKRSEIISKGYKSLERGRVIFDIRTQCYQVICSDAMANDPEFRKACIKYFNLSGNRYDFESLRHYRKQELTGNPTLDDFYYET